MEILREAKKLAQEYHSLTGKPLGITGEVAEYEAARILGIELTPARQTGYDAIERNNGSIRRLQVKGRCLLSNCKPGQRLGSIDIKKEWDAVLMVLLDENFDATEIHEAPRAAVIAALTAPGSKARNERGALSLTKFKAIGKLRWRRSGGVKTSQSREKSPLVEGVASVCPECGHLFKGNGFDGIDAHWRAKHEDVMPYRDAWPLIRTGSYKRRGGRS